MKPNSPGAEHALLRERVGAWIADDPDPDCRDELQAMLDAGQWAALRERFAAMLEFGTAGLRGELGAGPARMNLAGVARATAGLCAQLLAVVPNAAARGICIGFDARHMSRRFADECAAIAAGAGFRVHVFVREVPTPLLAFAVLDRAAAAGVMITASHNPARDNGFKVYWDNGAQLLAPDDVAIARHMHAIDSVRSLARVSPGPRAQQGLETPLGDELERAYLQAIAAQCAPGVADAGGLRIAYTALHGVGERIARAALSQAGFALESVSEQATPDPDFPTVSFPNPEEPGAMDRVLRLGERTCADLAIANDPDADRLAVAARDRGGRLSVLSGNEVGVLLADERLRLDAASGSGARFVLSSIVSTPMLGAIARAHGAHWEPTLTGFKWICNRALALERETGARFVFGFEEALGYCIGTSVRDKDGISAAVAIAALAARLRAQGRTLHDALEALFRSHGVHASTQISLRAEGADGVRRIASWMRQSRAQPPLELAGIPLRACIDLASGQTRGAPSQTWQLPTTNALLWELDGGHRVMLRPSGTEPKLKAYVDVREPVAAGEALDAARARARATSDALEQALRARLC